MPNSLRPLLFRGGAVDGGGAGRMGTGARPGARGRREAGGRRGPFPSASITPLSTSRPRRASARTRRRAAWSACSARGSRGTRLTEHGRPRLQGGAAAQVHVDRARLLPPNPGRTPSPLRLLFQHSLVDDGVAIATRCRSPRWPTCGLTVLPSASRQMRQTDGSARSQACRKEFPTD